MEEQAERELVEVPWKDLEPATLQAVIESFVLREGTDYGAQESLFTSKVESIKRQLEAGHIQLVYDSLEDSVTFLTSQELKRIRSALPRTSR